METSINSNQLQAIDPRRDSEISSSETILDVKCERKGDVSMDTQNNADIQSVELQKNPNKPQSSDMRKDSEISLWEIALDIKCDQKEDVTIEIQDNENIRSMEGHENSNKPQTNSSKPENISSAKAGHKNMSNDTQDVLDIKSEELRNDLNQSQSSDTGTNTVTSINEIYKSETIDNVKTGHGRKVLIDRQEASKKPATWADENPNEMNVVQSPMVANAIPSNPSVNNLNLQGKQVNASTFANNVALKPKKKKKKKPKKVVEGTSRKNPQKINFDPRKLHVEPLRKGIKRPHDDLGTSSQISGSSRSPSKNSTEFMPVYIESCRSGVKLDQSEVDQILYHLGQVMLSAPPSNLALQFYRAKLHNGSLCVFCANEQSKLWIKDQVRALEDLCDLKIVEPRKRKQRWVRVLTFIPQRNKELKEAEIRARLREQNQCLNVNTWRLLSKKIHEGKGVTLCYSIDEESLNALAKRKYRAYYMIGTVTFKVAKGQLNTVCGSKQAKSS